MPIHLKSPSVVQAAGNLPKRIEEYAGRINSGDARFSVARMVSPAGWQEPGQTPEFDEVTLVLDGAVTVESAEGVVEVRAGEAVIARAGEWVRYGTPQGATYIAVCVPAFAPDIVHRDS